MSQLLFGFDQNFAGFVHLRFKFVSCLFQGGENLGYFLLYFFAPFTGSLFLKTLLHIQADILDLLCYASSLLLHEFHLCGADFVDYPGQLTGLDQDRLLRDG